MIRVGIVGLGKMGLSHHAIINAHPRVSIEGVCDSAGFLLDVLSKYTGVRTFSRYEEMLDKANLDAIIIATPSKLHMKMTKAALDRGLHVFCEKPLCLTAGEGQDLVQLAQEKEVTNQVGYHHRFIGTFQEVKRLVDNNAIGEITHVLAESYGPVVLKSSGSTWRTQRSEGGSCLYDYAAHPLNLLNWYLGEPLGVGGSTLNKVFSSETEDEVVGTLYFSGMRTAQIFVNWSDESYRKMSTKISIWGKTGSIIADRQELHAYLRDDACLPEGYQSGWNLRYTTDLTNPVWFYLRGEEYSAQLAHFVECIESGRPSDNVNSFKDAAVTDKLIAMMMADAEKGPAFSDLGLPVSGKKEKGSFFSGFTARH